MTEPESSSPPITVVCEHCAAYLVSTSGETTTMMVRQHGKSGAGAAASIATTNPEASALLVNGVEHSKGTIKVVHLGRPDGSDGWASALSVDLQGEGTAAQGIFVTATTGPTAGNLIVLRNNDVDDFVVKGSGRVGVGVSKGMTPEATLEVVHRDESAPAVTVTNGTGSAAAIAAGTRRRVFEVGSDGGVTCRSLTLAGPGSSPRGGVLFVDDDGWLVFRGDRGTVTRLAGP